MRTNTTTIRNILQKKKSKRWEGKEEYNITADNYNDTMTSLRLLDIINNK